MPSPTNYDKLFNQAQGNELIGVLRGIKTAIGKNIGEVTLTENGEYSAEDLGYDSISDITVEVPNTYDVSDEGKVVSSGALVSQTSQTVTTNGTYDTTLKNEVVVNVAGGSSGGINIYSGENNPSSTLGSNNDLYIKYHEGYPEDTEYCEAVLNLAMTSNNYTDNDGYEFIVSASSVYDSNAQPYKAFDGGLGSGAFDCWHPTSGTPQWIQMQFPQKIIIRKFTIYNRPSYVEHPTAFTFQGSDDGSTWTDIMQVSWTATGQGISLDVTVPASQNGYYYYRWYITGVTSSPYGVIGEIKFTEVADPNVVDVEKIADEVLIKNNGTWIDTIGAVVNEIARGNITPIVLRSEWENLTTAQKQEYGLIVIQDANTGFQRGDYVNGVEYEDV